jgi:hypothetical protein
MPHEHYCVDDISLVGWLEDSASPTADIHVFVDTFEDIEPTDEGLLAPSTLESVPIGKGLHFYDLYSFDFSDCDLQHGVDRDAHSRLIIVRRRLTNIEVAPTLEASLENEGGNKPYTFDESGTAAIILGADKSDHNFAVLTIRGNSRIVGPCTLRSTAKSMKRVFVIRNKDDVPKYVRWVMDEGNVSEQDFFLLWNRAFPDLQKSDNLSFNRLSGNYHSLRAQVISHLSFLNDDFMPVFEVHKNNMFELTRVAKSQFGIDFSNESPKTRSSKAKMKQRNACFFGNEVTCEMHTKLTSTVNRIHFHPPVEKVGKRKVLIGIFVDHLDT